MIDPAALWSSVCADWTFAALKEVCDAIVDCPHSTPVYSAAGPLIARSQDIRSGHFLMHEAARVSETTYSERIARAEPGFGDLLYSREGTYFGIAAEVPSNTRVCLGQRMVLLRPNRSMTEPTFLRLWLNSPVFARFLRGFHDGSVAQRLNVATIRELPVPNPPLSVQQATACILGALDDKIDLNRQMNETLETMARALYRSWFVDFDPVVAKAAGKHPFGMDDATAALFPDRFVDSELGPIPEGWSAGPFSDLVEILSGGTPKTKIPEYWGGDIPWFSVVDSPSESEVFVIDTEKHITQAGIDSSAARIYDAYVTVITARGTVGKVALTAMPMTFNQSCYGLRGTSNGMSRFVYFATKALVDELQRMAHGSVFDTITRPTFESVKVAQPPHAAAAAFDSRVAPWLDLILNNRNESQTLARLRDLLLPKLLSGEIRVNDAEKAVQEVV